MLSVPLQFAACNALFANAMMLAPFERSMIELDCNVSAPIPGFVETFVDNGYTDMKQVMRALVAVDFRGILIADHVPQMIGDRRTAWAYSIGYIKALYDMARDERRGP